MLPSSTTSQCDPIFSQSNRASLSRGMRYPESEASTRPVVISRKSSSVTSRSGETRPAEDVISTIPGTPAGALAKARAYASLPRKYNPLMKLKISPTGTRPLRRRCQRADCPDSPKSKFPRTLLTFAGESTKSRRGREPEKQTLLAPMPSEGA